MPCRGSSLFSFSCLYFPGGANGKEPACRCRRHKRCGFDSWVGKIPWGRVSQSIPVFLPGKSHGKRRLACYSPWGCQESDRTEVTQHTGELLASACGISFSDQESNLGPQHWAHRVLATESPYGALSFLQLISAHFQISNKLSFVGQP